MRWPYLVWYGPNLPRTPPLPAQVLYGTASPGAFVDIWVYSPADGRGERCGQTLMFSVLADGAGQFRLDPQAAAWPLFGTTCRGEWRAVAQDRTTGLFSNWVSWRTAWFPVHLRP
ncbi:MAG: hypothetical protein QN194_16460 [Armatimonadota bacterium]|nr:hypothetical protein [Armatimonadota bacterium]